MNTLTRTLFWLEEKEVFASRWFYIYLVVFGGVIGGLILSGIGQTALFGYTGIGRLMAGVINLTYILVPLFSLVPAALSISGARENLALEYTLSLPVGKGAIFISKFAALYLASGGVPVLTLLAGYALLFGPRGTDFVLLVQVVGLMLLLGYVFTSLGLLVSAFTETRSKSLAVGLFLWFLFTIGGELGILSVIAASRVPTPLFPVLVLLNPAETFRVAAISLFNPGLDVLGPFGVYLAEKLGTAFLPLCAATLLGEGSLLIAAAAIRFYRRPL